MPAGEDRRQRLERLRALKSKSSKVFSESDGEDNVDIYDEVDNNEFREYQQKRIREDDFVVDDDGQGYIDNGAYEWDAEHNYYSDDESGPVVKNGKGKKRKLEEKTEKRTEADITAMFKKVANTKKPQKEITKEDEDFFDDLLEGMDDGLGPADAPEPKNKPFVSGGTRMPAISQYEHTSSPTRAVEAEPQVSSSPLGNRSFPSASTNANADISIDDLLDDVDVDEELSLKSIVPSASRPAEISNVRANAPKPVVAPSAAPTVAPSVAPTSAPVRQASPLPQSSSLDDIKKELPEMVAMDSMNGPSALGEIVEVDSFFWTDYAETISDLFFFGKAKLANGDIVNTSILVKNTAREVYFLPRKMTLSDPDVPVEMADVYEEVSLWYGKSRSLHSNAPFRAKPETMKYCFDKKDVPREAEYLKALLPFDINNVPASGETYSHVFGVTTPIFEQVVLSQKIKGPCWLELKNATVRPTKYTHSNLELEVQSPSCLTPVSKQDPMPPLTIMSLSIRTILNHDRDAQDIVALSASVFSKTQIDPTVSDNSNKGTRCSFTLVRPYSGARFPDNISQILHRKGKFASHTKEGSTLSHIDGELIVKSTEHELLQEFVKRCKHFDPDIILGHELEQTHLPLLLQRCREILPEKTYKELSRLPKSWPKYISYNSSVRQVLNGRLICDLYNTMGQSLTTACDTWSLTEMCEKYLDSMVRPDWEIDIGRFKERTEPLAFLSFLKNNEDDTLRTMRIASEIQMLPLTKQLTDIAGNSWSGTLTGSRVQRNEFILMHEFTRKGYLVPEKVRSDKHGARKEEQLADGEILPSKAKYQGGKVLDPKTGLYRSIVMVLDFNSLYPSIVREYNICFTTIPYAKYINNSNGDTNDEDVELPDGSVEQGIFPKLIEYLVETRKAIKFEMKRTSDAKKLKQFDIKQLALKLTANSMYGCLGFGNSRFYALPLATVITQKGREILTSTCDLALSNNLQVVYGDTDSVMVDTNVLWVGEANENVCASLMDKLASENIGAGLPFEQKIELVRQLVKIKQLKEAYDQAIEIGKKFKGVVNEQYKTLEIDIDNVFKTLLLNAKKKYAAVDLKVKPLALNQILGRSAANSQLVKFGESAISHLGLKDDLKEDQHIKGLDMVRREYCELSKQASKYVLTQILSDQSVGDVVDNVRAYLRKLADDARSGKHDLLMYVIRKKLNKSLEEYNNASRDQPHVQIALKKKAKNELVGKNEVVSYIITANPEGEPSLPVGKRAYTRREMLEQNLKPDIDFYLSKQILAPLVRLCDAVSGLGMSDLAACLGVHVNQSRYIDHSANNKTDYVPLEVTLSDEQKYQQASSFCVKCSCGESFEFKGLNKLSGKVVGDKGVTCPHCNQVVSHTRVNAQLECAIRHEIAKYYNGWLCCNECNTRTRQISVYGRRCLKKQDDKIRCTGIMSYEYSSKRLHYQLQYFYNLFDVAKAKADISKSKEPKAEKESEADILDDNEILARADLNSVRFSRSLVIVDKYIKDCGRAFVDMRDIFGMVAV